MRAVAVCVQESVDRDIIIIILYNNITTSVCSIANVMQYNDDEEDIRYAVGSTWCGQG